ncbi:MAG: hypothetical protein Q8O84_01985 [Nanoarchaeota archaeon]|nr:hypothetical protein [Nanoarchaeota archaeon]
MNKKIIMWIVIGALFLVALFLVFQAGSGATNSTGSAIDTTGWTADEIMNYEMHGTIPTGAGTTSASSSSGMVGGC